MARHPIDESLKDLLMWLIVVQPAVHILHYKKNSKDFEVIKENFHYLLVVVLASGCSCQWLFLPVAVLASGCSCQWLFLPVAVLASGCSFQWLFLPVAVFSSGCSCQWLFLPVVVLTSGCLRVITATTYQ